MEQFGEGRIHLLVGTTVIEVGIHAPGATVMVIQHPERFGLTQLHQLRGRVGRGKRKGCCFLMMPSKASEDTLSRLGILAQSNDGFEIAQKDLEIRGQGELMGIRQAGAGELDFTEMLREPELLMAAKKQADALIHSDPTLSTPQHRRLKQLLQGTLSRRLDL
jgi:ATP-dependent DNA helicase RecG